MAVDRSKFKAAPISAMKKLDGELGQRRGYSNYDRAGYHKIEDGDNKFRIYPAHPEDPNGVFWYPKSSVFLSLETELRDNDGEKTGEKAIKRRPVFTSDIHGPKELAGKDLVKMYIEFAKGKFDELFETEEEKKAVSNIMFNWQTGINPKLTWIMYADQYDQKGQKKLGKLEVTNGLKKKINELASDMDTGDSPIQVDPFTDPEDGIALIINKVGVKLDTEYKVSLETKKQGKMNFSFVPTPLEDDDLERFMKFEPLYKEYSESFTTRDFELEKEGLMRFDIENEFNFFEDEGWISIMEEMQQLVYSVCKNKEEDSDDETEKAPKETPKKAVMPKAKIVKEVVEEVEEEYEEEVEEEEEDNTPEPVKASVSEGKESMSDKMAALKARLSGAK